MIGSIKAFSLFGGVHETVEEHYMVGFYHMGDQTCASQSGGNIAPPTKYPELNRSAYSKTVHDVKKIPFSDSVD